MTDITMPQLGETVTEGTITRWFKQPGDDVAMDEVLFEVSTDKVDSEVPSPAAGTLVEIVVAEGETVEVGAVLARLGEAGAAPAASPATEPEPAAEPAPPAAEPAPPAAEPAPPAAEPAPPAPPPGEPRAAPSPDAATGPVLSPVVRRLINEHDLDPASISGTGSGGRITRADVEAAISSRGPAPAPAPVSSSAPAAAPSAPSGPAPVARAGDTVEPLNNIRRRTGEHMVMSKQVSPHVLTAVEVDFEAVERVRQAHKAAVKAEDGISLTYLPFITRALSDALREFPHMNATVGDGELIVHHEVNVAIAVDLDFQGLLAPVLRQADEKRLRAIARDIVDLAGRARSRQLSPDDLTGGTFTITNPGQYGTMMQFPIINQPQVAILSTDGIRRRPVVVTDEHGTESIGIHSVGVLALAWDHRAFDGAYAAAFLNRLREIIETHDWEAEL
ncbi:MAG: 2-oxoglutarate dehydrogenase, E2 component, dihydrolipoamide succinyltransferase [Acidimicrobiia bacterium]|nr:2-oxoglutarate dehydrogenase, E2 component, dihydrolipoamide succinyltransferase [Acidimicrobiia bacterium]